MAKNKLSIYLIKEGVNEEEIFEKESKVQILKEYNNNKKLYYLPSWIHSPNWLDGFFGMECDELHQANSRAVLIEKINIDGKEKIFALTFGYSKNLFAEDVLEEQFGLKIVLNTVGINDIRKISKVSVGSNQKQSQEQMPKATNINEFGFDLERDLIKTVTGKCNDETFEKANLIGGDIFSILVGRDINNIEDFLIYCYRKYREEKYKENFEWIDNIKEVKSKIEKEQLDSLLLQYINEEKYDCVWMSIPEVINWENVRGFSYTNDDEINDDIIIEKVIESLRNGLTDIEQLKRKRIVMKDLEDKEIEKWTAYKCIVAEVQLEEKSYCLNNGKWYCINKDFSDKIESEYEKIELSNLEFLDYDLSMEDEDDYNEKLSKSLSNAYLIHKIGEIPFGGGKGNKIELCDVMTKDNKLIHIKKNGGSAYLSHLFNQAAVSAELLLDGAFRNRVNKKMDEYEFDKKFTSNFNAGDYTIIIGIINKYHEQRPKIPFFSKVSLRYTINSIKNMGYKIELKNINKI